MSPDLENDGYGSNFAETIVRESRKPKILTVAGLPVLVLPEGFRVEDTEHLLPAPLRPKGMVELHDVDSFMTYVERHRALNAAIYCAADYLDGAVRFVAILDDHPGSGLAGWRDHRAALTLRHSPEWQTWKKNHKVIHDQGAFASFIEDNIRDIAGGDGLPTGSQMLEMAINFEANADARFRSALRLQSGGVDLTYVNQEDDATMQRMQAFDRFAIGIAPYLNGEAYRLTARLRYRVKEGRLALWYELIRPDIVIQDAVKGIIATIRAGMATVPLVLGAP